MILAGWLTTALAVSAAEIVVDGTGCTLVEAIQAANTDTPAGGCGAGSGSDVIQLDATASLAAPTGGFVEGGPSALPAITSEIEIRARLGTTIERSSGLSCANAEPTAFRLATVAPGGHLRLVELTLRNGCIAPGAIEVASGGAILVQQAAAIELVGVTIEGSAVYGAVAPNGVVQKARGGAVAVLGGSLVARDSTIANNRALGSPAAGGGMVAVGAILPELRSVELSGNRASAGTWTGVAQQASTGGGIALEGSDVSSIASCLFEDNLAGSGEGQTHGNEASGGGLSVDRSSRIGTIRDSAFVGNAARATAFSLLQAAAAHGGAIASSGFIDTIERATFAGNRALGAAIGGGFGGAIASDGNLGLMRSATFTSNEAIGGQGIHLTNGPGYGGAIWNGGDIASADASTITGNTAATGAGSEIGHGGGIWNAEGGTIHLTSTLMSANTANEAVDCGSLGDLVSHGYNLATAPDSSCAFAGPSDQTGIAAAMEPLADNGCALSLPNGSCPATIALPSDSAAVDQGTCSGSGVDGRGAVRPVDLPEVVNAIGGDGCDVGAFERDGAVANFRAALTAWDGADPVVSGSGPENLRYTIELANVGTGALSGVQVGVSFTLPVGVSVDAVMPENGSWDGSTWSVPALGSGDSTHLVVDLTVGPSAESGTDVIVATAAVTAADLHDGEFPTVAEETSVRQPILLDGFESGDTSRWSATVP